MSEAAEKKIADLERELAGTQEMLAFVLKAIGQPVVVDKALLKRGLGDNTQIQVDDDIAADRFIFSLRGEE